ncbi:MAG: hypothetical protein JWP43_175 [Ramlibacter sp.]|jgi:hypothetical protein|nr:hypothetical protein [Ramlibacter sp.]
MPRDARHLPSWPLVGRRSACAWLAAGAVLAACGNPPDDSPQRRTEERLVGTWLREYEENATRVRRVLVLDADGHFRELASVQTGDAVIQHVHSGDWIFDGTNLKRHYTQIDGERPARPVIPFATFEVRFPAPGEFVGVDNIHRREVRYRRVTEGTVP